MNDWVIFCPQITETYAFLPREAVTRFLTGCAECARRPRSTSPPPLPTPSPSPTRHFTPYLPAPEYRNWESEIDATTYYEPKLYTELQVKKVESPKPVEIEDPPTYIELTSKKTFDSPNFSRTSPVDPAFSEEEPIITDPEIDKDDSLIDVEDVKTDSPPLLYPEKEQESRNIESESTRAAEDLSSEKTEKKKFNPLDVANLTSKDPPRRSPSRRKLLPTSLDGSYGRFLKNWRSEYDDCDYSVPITTAYLKSMRMSFQERLEMETKVRLFNFLKFSDELADYCFDLPNLATIN